MLFIILQVFPIGCVFMQRLYVAMSVSFALVNWELSGKVG